MTCVQCENGKSISLIDSAQPTMAHDADTDTDLARPPDGKHPSARNATPATLLLSAMRRSAAGPLGIEEVRAGRAPGPAVAGPEQEDRGRIRADDVYPECWRSIH